MYPILFKIGPVTIYSFGVMAAAGFLIAFLLLRRQALQKLIPFAPISDLALGVFLFGLVGARVFFIGLNLHGYRDHPFEIFQLQKGGLVAYGGIVLAALFGIWFTRFKKIPFWEAADLAAPLWPIGLAIGRIGCFLNGCCYGRSGGFFGTHPTQLYESLGLWLLAAGLFWASRRPLRMGQLFALSLVGYAALRFALEFLRGDQLPAALGLTLPQWMSFAAIGIAAWIWSSR